MRNLYIVLDYINLKYLLESISDFARKSGNNGSDISDCKKIIGLILEDVCAYSSDYSKTLLKIQKYLSSDIPTSIQVIDDINTGNWDKQLKTAIDNLYACISKLPKHISLIHWLFEHCFKTHFADSEYAKIQSAFQAQDYSSVLFLLFKHAFANYQHNLPGLLSKRLYEEALTISTTNEMRYNLFKESADLGNSVASLEYAEYMYSRDLSIAIDYYIKALPISPALWCIGFALESGKVSDSQYNLLLTLPLIKKTVLPYYEKEKTVKPFRAKDISSEYERNCTELAFAIYLYLANAKDPFPKAQNSVGKFLINQIIVVKNENPRESTRVTRELGVSYLEKAIYLGNSNAMVNLASFYIKQNALGKHLDKKQHIIPLLEVAASLGELTANVLLSDIFIEHKQFEIAKEYLEFAHNHENAAASHKLAEIFEAEGDRTKALQYYETAIARGYADSAFNIALLHTNTFAFSNNGLEAQVKPNIIYIKELLRKAIPRMSNEVAMKSSAYIMYLDNTLSKT